MESRQHLKNTKRSYVEFETQSQYNSRWRSIRIIYFSIFMANFCLYRIVPIVYHYIYDKSDLSGNGVHLISNYCICGNIIWTIALGLWSYKLGSIRIPMYMTLLFGVLGNLMFSAMAFFNVNSQIGLSALAFILGGWLASTVLCRSYLSAATKLIERTQVFAMSQFAQIFGGMLGTRLPMLMENVFQSPYYSTGLINSALCIINMLILLPWIFREHKISAKEMMIKQGDSCEEETCKSIRPNYLSVGILIVIFFVLASNLMAFNTISQMYAAQFDTNSIHIMDIVRGVSLVVIMMIGALCKYCGERFVFIIGGLLMILMGQPICFSHNFPDYSVFIMIYAIEAVGSPIFMTLVLSITTKQLGPRPQGGWMVLLTILEVLFMNLGIWLLNKIVTDKFWVIAYSIIIISIIIVLLCFKQILEAPTVEKIPNLEERMLGLESHDDCKHFKNDAYPKHICLDIAQKDTH